MPTNALSVSKWDDPVQLPFGRRQFIAGGGIAFNQELDRISDSKHTLARGFASRKKHRVNVSMGDGYGIYPETGRVRRVHPELHVPVELTTEFCSTLGALFGDVTGNGEKNDFIIVFVTVPRWNAQYIVPFDLDYRGKVRGGFSDVNTITHCNGRDTTSSEAAERVANIGALLVDTTGSGTLDLVVHVKARPVDMWQAYAFIGRDITRRGAVFGGRPARIPTPRVTAESEKIADGCFPEA